MSRPHLIFAYFGHHKCASTWIHRILSFLAVEAGWRTAYLHNPSQFKSDLGAYLGENPVHVLSYVNAEIEAVRSLGPVRGFHVIRDPRDLLVSAYFSHLHSHPTTGWPQLEEHRRRLQALPKDEGLALEMEFSGPVLQHIADWDYDQPRILEVRQEELTASPEKGFLAILRHCGALHSGSSGGLSGSLRWVLHGWNRFSYRRRWLPALPLRTSHEGRVQAAVAANRFASLSGGRIRGEEDPRSHYRSGVPGDWRKHFTPDLVETFKDRFGPLAVKLGYEASPDWTVSSQELP